MRAALPPDLRAIDLAIYDDWKIQKDGFTSSTSAAFEAAWVAADINLMARAHFTREDIARIGASLEMRPGAHWFLRYFAPPFTAIVSFGVEPLIRSCLEKNRFTYAITVYAAGILFTAGGSILCADPRNFVVSETKGEAAQHFLAHRSHLGPRNVLVIGDDPAIDGKMWAQGQLNILITPWKGMSKVDRVTDDHVAKHELTLLVSDLDTLNAFLSGRS